jgi:ATP-dependent Clp protease ATP-binding subunit ClpC
MTMALSGELARVRTAAHALAESQRLDASTAHVLAALAEIPGAASDLLLVRRLDRDTLVRGARVSVDEAGPSAIERTFTKAREFSTRCGHRSPDSIHVLFALCQDPKSAASRTLTQCGTDVTKLRTAVMQIAMGLTSPVRVLGKQAKRGERNQGEPVNYPPPRAPKATPAPSAPATPVPPRTVVVERAAPSKAKRSKGTFDPKRAPLLAKIGHDLAAQHPIDQAPVVGRIKEVARVLDAIGKKHGRAACLVGPVGVGRKSIVRAVAAALREPPFEATVMAVGASALLSGTLARGSLAERLHQVFDEVKRSQGRIVLFLEDLGNLLGTDGGNELSELRAAIERGEAQVIAIATPEEYRRWSQREPALTRSMVPIDVTELPHAHVLEAVGHAKESLEQHHGVRLDDAVITDAIAMTGRYVRDAVHPDKAVRFLDLAAARARRQAHHGLDRATLASVVSEATGVPSERLLETDDARMRRLDELLQESIVGHAQVVSRISRILRRNAAGLRSTRPLGTFLLLGPTGVGKTETAKGIARALFDSDAAMTRLDLSEFAESHSIARLIGSPPGYVGHEDGGLLTEAVKKRPYQVLLLDEVEKAHRDVLLAFLQVFDEGRLTDSRGVTVDFCNTVIVMTSNLGSNVPRETRSRIGFHKSLDDNRKVYEAAVVAAARERLAPELYNRIDEVLALSPLSSAETSQIADKMLRALRDQLAASKSIRLEWSKDVVAHLLDKGGYEPSLGARPLRRAIARLVEAPLADAILAGRARRDRTLRIDLVDGELVVAEAG